MNYLEHRLSNGLTILCEENPSAYTLGVGFFVRTGSRDETVEVGGVSHFLEHMCFKGSEKRSAADVSRELDELGAVSNAETSEEHTAYYIAALPEFQDHAVDLLADIMRPSLREKDFETEKGVILEEIAKYEDQPPFGAFEKSVAAYFGNHALGRPVLGTRDTVGNMTAAGMREYFARQYSPGNMALVAAGKVDFDRLVEQAEQICGEWEPFQVQRDTAAPPVQQGAVECVAKDIAQQYVLLLIPGPGAESDERYAARLTSMIVGEDSGSRLFWELVDNGRAEVASLFSHEYLGCGITFGYLCCAPDDAQENLDHMVHVIGEASEQGIEPPELQRVQGKASSSLVLASERPRNRMFDVGYQWLRGREYRTVRTEVDNYLRLTAEDINRQLQQWPLKNPLILSVGPNTELQMPNS